MDDDIDREEEEKPFSAQHTGAIESHTRGSHVTKFRALDEGGSTRSNLSGRSGHKFLTGPGPGVVGSDVPAGNSLVKGVRLPEASPTPCISSRLTVHWKRLFFKPLGRLTTLQRARNLINYPVIHPHLVFPHPPESSAVLSLIPNA